MTYSKYTVLIKDNNTLRHRSFWLSYIVTDTQSQI